MEAKPLLSEIDEILAGTMLFALCGLDNPHSRCHVWKLYRDFIDVVHVVQIGPHIHIILLLMTIIIRFLIMFCVVLTVKNHDWPSDDPALSNWHPSRHLLDDKWPMLYPASLWQVIYSIKSMDVPHRIILCWIKEYFIDYDYDYDYDW